MLEGYCLPDSCLYVFFNPETSSRVTLASLGIGFQPNLLGLLSLKMIRTIKSTVVSLSQDGSCNQIYRGISLLMGTAFPSFETLKQMLCKVSYIL